MSGWSRSLALAIVLALGAVACGGEPAPPSPSAPPPSSSAPSAPPATASIVTETPSGTLPPGIDDVRLPPRAPTSFADDVPASELTAEPLAPRDAVIGSSLGDDLAGTFAFSWSRGRDPLAAETGFEVWVRFEGQAPAWRVKYAFTDDPATGVLGVRFSDGDLTGDGVPDLLTFEDMGGSGACGMWRVVLISAEDAVEAFRKQTCDTDVRIVGGDLEVRAAVFAPGDAHCCPSAYRITRLRWTGDGWEVVDRATEPT